MMGSPGISRTPLGSFSYSPARNILGSMLDAAASATAPNNTFQTHRKIDNTGYSFQGRSFGVGASVGLASLPLQSGLQNFTFEEVGYFSNITCWYNTSMEFHVNYHEDPDRYDFYNVNGVIPSGLDEGITLAGFEGDKEIVALSGNPEVKNIWGIATGRNATKYAQLNQTACQVVFQPTNFRVTVDPIQKLISVSRLGDALLDPDPSINTLGVGGKISNNTVQQVGLLAQTSASCTFSPLGNGKFPPTLSFCKHFI